MFRQRLLTTLILIPLVLIILFYAPPWILGILAVLISVLAAIECWQLIPINLPLHKGLFLFLLVVAVGACFHLLPYWITIGLLCWLCICIAVLSFPQTQAYWGRPLIVTAVLLIIWPLFIQSMNYIYWLPQGKGLIVYLLCLVWAADIGAYLVGKRWGHTKLIPRVSPGKSWEGVLGGFGLAMLIAALSIHYYTPFSYTRWFFWSGLATIMSVFGDLFMSILKRRCNLKDTGSIIHGHGGILDRLDSLMAAAPVFYLGLTYIPLGI
ncbi:MAG: phosphatidate cytidylyltransferase [Legionella sp.]|nr:phosphatidate cytidylyltransferase [Legionella sp.]